MIRYAITIFLSAFLLFAIQPMIAKSILPWFGGTAAVWTTCLMFFQVSLVLGYLYSHLVRRFLSPRGVWLCQLALLAVAAMTLLNSRTDWLALDESSDLTLSIIKVLLMTIGLPFFVLATTGPLVQAWQSTTHPTRSPYRLYALSNLGSMMALLSYPFVFERLWGLRSQSTLWNVGFLLFAAFSCWSGWQILKHASWRRSSRPCEDAESPRLDPQAQGAGPNVGSSSIGFPAIAAWLCLAMAPSIVLLATTNLMCQEVASFPFLWVLPLSLYLLSFIICFERPALYRRFVIAPLTLISVLAAVILVHLGVYAPLIMQVAALAAACFLCAMTCHGELERLKPSPQHLTLFYLLVATGGAMGGVFVVIVAPQIFDGFYEFHIGLLACLILPLCINLVEAYRGIERRMSYVWIYSGCSLIAATFVMCSWWYFLDRSYHPGLVFRDRNEYGLVSVQDNGDYRILINGQIEHGGQFLESTRSLIPNGYYVAGSGAAVAIKAYRRYLRDTHQESELNLGVIGLGAGSMVAWLRPDDQICFYEINPLVERVAREHFTYLQQCESQVKVVLGDGRVQLMRELERDGSNQYDILFVDAFSSDSIPVHLLTDECFGLYQQHLKPDGILAVHITNRFVDLCPVVYGIATQRRWTPVLVDHNRADRQNETRWVLMTANELIGQQPGIIAAQVPWPPDLENVVWTDDYASLAPLVEWTGEIQWQELFERKWRTKSPNDRTAERLEPHSPTILAPK